MRLVVEVLGARRRNAWRGLRPATTLCPVVSAPSVLRLVAWAVLRLVSRGGAAALLSRYVNGAGEDSSLAPSLPPASLR